MRRLLPALIFACLLVAAAVAGPASAADIQVGATTTALAAPTCQQEATVTQTESNCQIALAKTTAYETLSDGTANPDLITQPGMVVSFTVGISGLFIQGASLSSVEAAPNSAYGGPPSVQLTVLRPVASRKGLRWAVAAQSPVIPLQPYITGQATGSVTEFPLINPLPVVRGEMLALTIPTWAPILSIGLSSAQFSYIQAHSPQVSTATGASKAPSCQNDVSSTRAQATLGQQAQYRCTYQGTRLEYSALEVTAPAINAAIRHGRARTAHAAHRARHAKHARAQRHTS